MPANPATSQALSRGLAPPGREGLFMGYAFLPIAIGYFVAGVLGGYLLHYFGEVAHRPQQMWWVVSGVGVATTLLMVCYDRWLKPAAAHGADSKNA